MDLEKIVLVELDSDLPNFGQLLAMPRFGITAIGSILNKAGYKTKVLSDVYGKVSVDDIFSENPKYIMFNGIRASINKVRSMSNTIKRKNQQIPIIMGGEGATIYPEKIKEFADYIVLYEGDKTILNLISSLELGKDLSKINGIMYKNSRENWITTKKPERIKEINYSLNPSIFKGLKNFGRKNLLARKINLTPDLRFIRFPIQTSRGCEFTCSFCSKDSLFGGSGYFERDIGKVITDIDRIMEYSGITRFSIVDNLFGGSKDYLKRFFREIISHYEKGNIKPKFSALMRADQFDNKTLNDGEISLMRTAGFENICIGMESINKKTLEQYNKKIEISKYTNAIRRLSSHNINVIGTFGVGGGEDCKKDISATVKFAKRRSLKQIHLYAFSITPNTVEYKKNRHQIIPRIDDKYWNGHAVTIFPRRMLPSELQRGIFNAMRSFYPLTTPIGLFYRRMLKKIESSLTGHLFLLEKRETELIDRKIYEKNQNTGNWELNEEKLKNTTS